MAKKVAKKVTKKRVRKNVTWTGTYSVIFQQHDRNDHRC